MNCNIWESSNKQTLSLEAYKQLFKENKNLIWLSLTGGEPFLRPDIVEIAKAAEQYCPDLMFLSIPTDGYRTKLIVEKAKQLNNMNFEFHLTISVDGPREVHDKIRGLQGAYDAAMKTYKALQEEGIHVRLQSTLHRQNLDVFKEFYRENKKDIGVLTFTQISDIYYGNDQSVKPLTGQEAADVFKFIDENYKMQKKQDIFEKMHIKIAQQYMKKKDMMLPCTAGFSGAFISSSGDVHPCFFMKPWGNIKEQSFKDIWFNKIAEIEREKIKKKQCPKCWINCFSFQDMLTYPEKAIARSYLNVPPK